MNRFLDLGLIGFAVALATNLVAWKYFGKASAAFFTDGWWSMWFSNYVVWISFLCVGIGKELKGRATLKG